MEIKTNKLSSSSLAKYLDFANHHPDSTKEIIATLCSKVIDYGFNSAFVNPVYVEYAKEKLSGKAKVGTVVSFPLGQETLETKLLSAETSILAGADEIDVSLNVGFIKEGDWARSETEMKAIVGKARETKEGTIVKFIPETGFLTSSEIKKTAELILESGADFFKTCSGLGPRGASLEDVKLVREAIGDKLRIKVAGGIDTLKEALDFIEAGADRIGTSHAEEIIKEFTSKT